MMMTVTRKTALILDDSEIEIHLLKSILKYLGFEVYYFMSAQEGISYSKDYPCDVIFLDLLMPGENGIEILKSATKDFPWLDTTPILVISGLGDLKTVTEALSLGADGYVIKPYSTDLIRRQLKKAGVL